MPNFSEFWKNSKWPTSGHFKMTTVDFCFALYFKNYDRRLIFGSGVPFMTMTYILGIVADLSEVAFFQNGRFLSKIP